jgi:hypothetical protein
VATFKTRSGFSDSVEGLAVKQKLQFMMTDKTYNTESSYNANSLRYPGNLMTFVDKHMNYLNTHPSLDARMYLANLRLMTRIR